MRLKKFINTLFQFTVEFLRSFTNKNNSNNNKNMEKNDSEYKRECF